MSSEFKNNLYKEFNITESILYDIINNTYQPYTEVISKEDEFFKPIPNYEEYMISNYGTVLAKSGKELVSFKKGKPHKKKLTDDQLNEVIFKTRSLHDIMGKWGFTPKLQAIADKYGVHKETIRQIMINDKKSLT